MLEAKDENKKQKIAVIIGVVTLLIAVLGATFAYFQISTETIDNSTTITGSTPSKTLVTLTPVVDNLHLNISASDMSYENRTREYYGTNGEDQYVGTEELGTKTIAEVGISGGEATTKFNCTAKLTVSKVTEPKEQKDTMVEVLQPGDIILQFKGNIISEKLDLSELKENNSKDYNLNFKINGSTPETIKAYIKLLNKDKEQNYLAEKKLNVDISINELNCELHIPDPKIAELRKNDTQGYLSEELQGGMHRFQAVFPDSDSSEMTNWICFGTKDNCGTNDNNIDKYMYRIIGITEEGQMYLLKETFLKEKSENELNWNDKFNWNDLFNISDCLGEECEWSNSDIYKRLNGEVSNGNPIFVNNNYYEYMAQGSKWYELIENHNWMYGDTIEDSESIIYNGKNMYLIETGDQPTKRYWPDIGQETCSNSTPCTEKEYTWINSIPAKIGLMYMHDLSYAYYNGIKEESRGNPGNATNVANSWIHFQKDGYNSLSNFEWLSTRLGVYDANGSGFGARLVRNTGYLNNYNYLNNAYGVRPVFYLKSEVKIIDGTGIKGDPYILS